MRFAQFPNGIGHVRLNLVGTLGERNQRFFSATSRLWIVIGKPGWGATAGLLGFLRECFEEAKITSFRLSPAARWYRYRSDNRRQHTLHGGLLHFSQTTELSSILPNRSYLNGYASHARSYTSVQSPRGSETTLSHVIGHTQRTRAGRRCDGHGRSREGVIRHS